jgi:hypothetical protein
MDPAMGDGLFTVVWPPCRRLSVHAWPKEETARQMRPSEGRFSKVRWCRPADDLHEPASAAEVVWVVENLRSRFQEPTRTTGRLHLHLLQEREGAAARCWNDSWEGGRKRLPPSECGRRIVEKMEPTAMAVLPMAHTSWGTTCSRPPGRCGSFAVCTAGEVGCARSFAKWIRCFGTWALAATILDCPLKTPWDASVNNRLGRSKTFARRRWTCASEIVRPSLSTPQSDGRDGRRGWLDRSSRGGPKLGMICMKWPVCQRRRKQTHQPEPGDSSAKPKSFGLR